MPLFYFPTPGLDTISYGSARRHYMRRTCIGNELPMFYYIEQAAELLDLIHVIRSNDALKQTLFEGNNPNLLQIVQNLEEIAIWSCYNDIMNEDFWILDEKWIKEIRNVFGIDANGQFIVDADGRELMAQWFEIWLKYEDYMNVFGDDRWIYWYYIMEGLNL